MHWIRFERSGATGFGRLQDDLAIEYEGDMYGNPVATGQAWPLAQIRLLTPCSPGKFICLWNNFRASAAKQELPVPAEPLYLLKPATSYAASGDAIRAPAGYQGKVVFEGELGVVIGRRGRDIPLAAAAGHIFGFTVVNDVTAIDLLHRDASFVQWTRAKGCDGFGIFGPVIATGIDPQALVVRARLDGRERQNYPVSDAIFSPAAVVSRMSREMTLEAGDLIAIGTSLGVAPMRPGMTVEIEIEGIGKLVNRYEGAATPGDGN
jgi:2-keto-4-pentenoate hydratase/2-oxohepta-3-ene-1,7-dioic acid hydratase in catechol pathway